ncbi:MAG: DUF86 domain-containing protein [Deltaproteobacteria bacterium]|nr:DUF86 domain-containing protein [Deltaproteobacteria bacterium]
MYDQGLAIEILTQILSSARTILRRFEPIQSIADFTDSETGLEKLDAICIQLIAIGEALKKLDKITHSSLLRNYPHVDWKKVMGMRDIISHHYFDLNAEAIFFVCRDHVQELANTIRIIIKDQSASQLPPDQN